MKKYKWMSYETGELQTSFWNCIKVSIENVFRYHIFRMQWKYNKKGW